MIRLLLSGATGRTGGRILALARDDSRFNIRGTLRDAAPDDNFPTAVGHVEALIDFSSDAGAQRAILTAHTLKTALLIGTTGLSDTTESMIRNAVGDIPVLVASNTSMGIAIMRHLVREAALRLGNRSEYAIVETHHKKKRDAPSGTAKSLAKDLENVKNSPVSADQIRSIRSGDVVGEHEVVFSMSDERLVIRHAALDRDVFARGALDATAWLVNQPPGRYAMGDMLESAQILG